MKDIQTKVGEYFWHQGYFAKNGKWERDFDELLARDLSIATLGNISGQTILDVGCGNGLYALTFAKMGAKEVCGQDISEELLIFAKDFCKDYPVSLTLGDCCELQFENNVFDSAFSGDVFEHITTEQKRKFISEVYRVLKPGGIFTIKTPNKSYLKLSNFFRRINGVLHFKNPFNIHIPHTRNNPNNEHHGLGNYSTYRKLFKETMFHEPVITRVPLNKNKLTLFFWKLFPKVSFLNSQIIITVRKPVFYSMY